MFCYWRLSTRGFGIRTAAARDARRKDTLLIGINSRDLQTLEVVHQRFTALAPLLPESAAAWQKAAWRRRPTHARCASSATVWR